MATNGSRTMLYNIHDNSWDDELLQLLDIPASLLPEIKDSSADFGVTEKSLFGGLCPFAGSPETNRLL